MIKHFFYAAISINFIVPQGRHELSDKQLHFAYNLIAQDFATDEINPLCLLQWSGTKVIGRQVIDEVASPREDPGSYLLKRGKVLFEVTPLTLAELLPHLDWLGSLPTVPVRISKINRAHALPADFSEVPFETYIIVDNLYRGYLQTQSDLSACRSALAENLLDELANVLYGKPIKLKPYERINIFYWVASLKDFFARRYPDFLQPVSAATDGNLLGSSAPSVEEAMNAQIRALTSLEMTATLNGRWNATAFVCVSDIADGYTELNNTPRTRRVKTVFFAMRHAAEDMAARSEYMEIQAFYRWYSNDYQVEKQYERRLETCI